MQAFFDYIFRSTPAPRDQVLPAAAKAAPAPFRWRVAGLLLLAIFSALFWMSGDFQSDIPLAERPIILFTSLLLLAGLTFMFISELILHSRTGRKLMLWILACGALLRLLMLFSTPILENDFHRYLWDGAVSANGLNAYQYAPAEVLAASDGENSIPAVYQKLAASAPETLEGINHAYLRTIYPPLAQAAFAAAHFLSPYSLIAWRLVLLLADIATLLLLLALLRELQRSPLWISLYWLNPLVIKELINSGHMDLLLYPFLTGALLMLFRRQHYGAMGLLGIATGVKIWPVLLLPVFWKKMRANTQPWLAPVLLYGFLSTLFLLPLLLNGLDSTSGLNAYSQRWQLNDSIFKIALGLSYLTSLISGIPEWHIYRMARILIAAIMIAWVWKIFRKPANDDRSIADQCLLIVAAIFLLSPTQFPWYATWLTPFLVLSPRKALLWLTPLLSLYYLRYHFEAGGNEDIFDYYIVWLEYLPVWYLIIQEWRQNRRRSRPYDPGELTGYEKTV